jgi:hypothetical protein
VSDRRHVVQQAYEAFDRRDREKSDAAAFRSGRRGVLEKARP